MKDWCDKFRKVAIKFNDFGKSLKGVEFHPEKQAAETLALTCIKLCREDASSIALLIEEGLYCEAMMILRSSLELLFKIHWVYTGANHDEQNERTFCLEGNPLSGYQKEINFLRERTKKADAEYSFDFVKQNQDAIDKHKADYPYLVNSDDRFKTSPNNIDMAGDMIRQKFYHVYRYLCIFNHPTPILRDFILSEDSGERIFRESVEQALGYGIAAYQFIMGFCSNVLSKHVPETHDVREKLYNEMKELAK